MVLLQSAIQLCDRIMENLVVETLGNGQKNKLPKIIGLICEMVCQHIKLWQFHN